MSNSTRLMRSLRRFGFFFAWGLSCSALVVACRNEVIVQAAADAGSPNPEVEPDGGGPSSEAPVDAGPKDGGRVGWPGCAALPAMFCDDFDGPAASDWTTRLVPDGGTVEIASASAVSHPNHLRTALPPAPANEIARLGRDMLGLAYIDYAAEVRIVSRGAGPVAIHEIFARAGIEGWSLSIELASDGDRLVERTFEARRVSPLSRSLPNNAWVKVRVTVDIGFSAARAVVRLDEKIVADHRINPPGAAGVWIFAGQRALDATAGGSIVDFDNVVLRTDE